jgi:hypothetical protein
MYNLETLKLPANNSQQPEKKNLNHALTQIEGPHRHMSKIGKSGFACC